VPLQYLETISQTAAPTFEESARAELIAQLWTSFAAQWGRCATRDAVGNVQLRLGPPTGKALVLASHLDTVFAAGTDVTIQKQSTRWVGPGCGDNSSSLAVLTAFLRDLEPHHLRRPLWLVANVGEEGLGDLRGAKALLTEEHPNIGAFVAVDGYLGFVVSKPVGVRRFRASFHTTGGHSWGERSPSAIHTLAHAVTSLYNIPLPSHPRTTLNVGMIEGGTSVNSIAAQASLLLDLRSLEGESLALLEHQAKSCLQAVADAHNAKLELKKVGDRPAGDLNNAQLLKLVRQAAQGLNLEIKATSSSTDANAAAPYGIPALAMGVYLGGNAHRLDEWIMPASLERGKGLLERFVALYQRHPLE
jgi:tripeptide aminopeptidase